jgi:1,4-alpha-glucan branching enzyme
MLSQDHIGPNTPMGGNLTANGATFKVWAPGAQGVYLNGTFGGNNRWTQDRDMGLLLQKDNAGYWCGFLPGAGEGDPYKFYVVGAGSRGYKRDPYARELSFDPPFPHANCLLREPGLYPWHDQGFVTPDYSNMIIYQLHVGTFYSKRPGEDGTFLDVVEKIEYLSALAIDVLQLLPIDEFETQTSQGYNGSDLFSPESRYGVSDQVRLAEYLATVNRLLAQKQQAALKIQDLTPVPNQLKALVDLCHLYGIAVVFDVVYNHAGGFDGDDESLYFWDREQGNNDSSLYFTSQGWAGGLSFALWKREVGQFLIDNAVFHLREFHVDGLRYDEISVLVALNQNNGWTFCQNLTNTLRFQHDRAIQNAEFWPVNSNVVKSAAANGAGFDVTQHDALRLSVRQAIGQAAGGGSNHVDMDGIAATLYPPGFPQAWKAVPCVENHDEVFSGRSLRIPRLADGSNAHSFYARSRSRVATGLLLTAPGIPQLFMGQEFLEDKQWNDNPSGPNRIYWEGLASGDKPMVDFLRFTQDLIRLRWNQPAVRSSSIRVFHVHNDNRILAFHRWLEGEGRDVVVVVSLNDQSLFNYAVGFPRAGRWAELFNSDVYDNWVNPAIIGNGGQIYANGGPMHGFANSAAIAIPPNSIVVFGD